MPKSATIATPVRVRIVTRGGEGFVTSRYQAGDFYVTPDIRHAVDIFSVELIDKYWTRFERCSVTHGPSGRTVSLLRVKGEQMVKEAAMGFVLARLFVNELAARPEVIQPAENDAGFVMDGRSVLEASEVARRAHERQKAKKRGPSARKAG